MRGALLDSGDQSGGQSWELRLFMKTLIIAALAATFSISGLAGTAASAAESVFPAVEPAALRVSTKGLNLRDARDLATLQTRIDKAINKACNPYGSYFAQLGPQRECRAALTAHTNPILANLSDKADKSRMAEF